MNVEYGGGNNTIQFEGVMEDYEVEKTKGNGYQITFLANTKNENFNVYIKLNPNLTSDIVLNGTSRRTIRYSGKVIPQLEN